MFNTSGQFYIFTICVFIGIIGGMIFDIIYPFRKMFQSKILEVIFDFCGFALTAGIYILMSFKCLFPSPRIYMVAGLVLGMFLELKSIHIIVAKLLKKEYNKKKIIKKEK